MNFPCDISVLFNVKVSANAEPDTATNNGKANLINKCVMICKLHRLKIHHKFSALKVLARKPSTFISKPPRTGRQPQLLRHKLIQEIRSVKMGVTRCVHRTQILETPEPHS